MNINQVNCVLTFQNMDTEGKLEIFLTASIFSEGS